MKKFILLIMLGLLVTAGLLTGCGIIVTPSGPESTRDYKITDFSNINVGGPFEAQIIQADNYKVTITANENLFKYVDISKTGSTLNVKTRPLSLVGSHVLKAEISLPKLGDLSVSGGARSDVSGFNSTGKMDIKVSGGAQLNMDITTGDTNIAISAGSNVKGDLKSNNTKINLSAGSQCNIAGSGADTALVLSAGSAADLVDFNATAVDVRLSAGSRASVRTDGRLDIRVSDGSTLVYYGSPDIGTIETSGGSTIRHD